MCVFTRLCVFELHQWAGRTGCTKTAPESAASLASQSAGFQPPVRLQPANLLSEAKSHTVPDQCFKTTTSSFCAWMHQWEGFFLLFILDVATLQKITWTKVASLIVCRVECLTNWLILCSVEALVHSVRTPGSFTDRRILSMILVFVIVANRSCSVRLMTCS